MSTSWKRLAINGLFASAVLAAGNVGAAPPNQNVHVPALYDANNKLIGPLLGSSSVLVTINGVQYSVPATKNGFISNNTPQFIYLQPDCSGTKYVDMYQIGTSSAPDINPSALLVSGLYLINGNFLVPSPPYTFVEHGGYSINQGACVRWGGDIYTAWLVPQSQIKSYPSPYVPPFSLR